MCVCVFEGLFGGELVAATVACMYVCNLCTCVCMCECARLRVYEGLLGRAFLLNLLHSSRIEKNARSTAITTALPHQKRAALTL